MSTITVQEIQRDPLAFVQRIEAGESLVVLSGDRPVAEVRPVLMSTAELRPYGLCAGQITVGADFDRPLPPEVLDEFDGA
jgi:antitoxin (DNA-binding transcriptional repressor) of toxin-antitoxin stability system